MRPSALVPLLFSFVAFILSMLCIFAGSKTGYLENANMMTVRFLQENPISCKHADFPLAQYIHARAVNIEHLEKLFLHPELSRERCPQGNQ